MWETLMLEAHQNDRSYVCELSGLAFNSLHKNFSMVGSYSDDLIKITKVGDGCLHRDRRLHMTIW